jgi:hypothetical protein
VWQHGTYFIGSSGLQSGKQDWSTGSALIMKDTNTY